MLIDLVDKLVDRVIQLLTYQQKIRATLLETYVTPVFMEFEKVHSAYLESFSNNRDFILSSEESSWIKLLQTKLEKDNLFSADCRSKVIRLAEAERGDSLEPFVKGVSEYLLGARLVDSLGKQNYPHMVQRWRQSLFRTLDRIAEEHWQLVFDPIGARPPMTPKEIDGMLEQIHNKYQIGERSITNQDALKRACALWALDDIVMDMQSQYDYICQTYVELRSSLSK
jgi:hypothetical protein